VIFGLSRLMLCTLRSSLNSRTVADTVTSWFNSSVVY
jgi:hypothetical protein